MLISIKEVEAGMKLKEDVYSKLGGIIFKKGTILKIEDREILDVFKIENINIEKEAIDSSFSNDKSQIERNEKKQEEKLDPDNIFTGHFNQALKVVDNIMKLAQGNAQIPIMELRKAIQPLLHDDYTQFKYLTTLKFSSSDQQKYYTHHSLAVGIIANAIAKWKGLEQGERMQIALAGVLHDIGINRVTVDFISKSGSLTRDEYKEVKNHTLYGYQLLKTTKGLTEGTTIAVLQHHERLDGSGYPLRIKQDNIHQYAKIIAVADVFHALISKRSYREGNSVYQAIDQIIKEEVGKLDPAIVNIFINGIIKFSNGARLLLSNGKEGMVVFVDQHNPTRPWVKVGEEIINLVHEKQLFIKDII